MRWMAVLICLLPERHTRSRPLVEPDHPGIGARPAYLAKALSLGKRSTFAASEINLAAVNSAHPGSVGCLRVLSSTKTRTFAPCLPGGQLTLPSQMKSLAPGRLQKHPLEQDHFPQQPDERNLR
jgi:hypothetical protein